MRANRDVLSAADFDEARDRIILGRREGSNVLLPDEKHAVAVHEAGHALVAAYSDKADPVAKVTILPAGQALGVTEQLPLVERHLYGEDYLHDTLAVFLGGRASELVVLGQGSTGAANDLAKATDLATKMVREFGLSSAIGPVGYPSGGSVFLGGGGRGFSSRPFAEADPGGHRRRGLAAAARGRADEPSDVLNEHRDVLDKLVDAARRQRDRGRLGGLRPRRPPRARRSRRGHDDGTGPRRGGDTSDIGGRLGQGGGGRRSHRVIRGARRANNMPATRACARRRSHARPRARAAAASRAPAFTAYRVRPPSPSSR